MIAFFACGPRPKPQPNPPIYKPSYRCTATPAYAQGCAAAAAGPNVALGVLEGTTFTPLDESATNTLPLHPGPQGGYHAYLEVRTDNVCASWVMTTVRLREPGAASVLRLQQYEMGLLDRMGGGQQTGQLVFFVCPSQLSGTALAGAALELEAAVVDCTGASEPLWTKTFTVVPTCPAGDTACTDDGRAGCAAP